MSLVRTLFWTSLAGVSAILLVGCAGRAVSPTVAFRVDMRGPIAEGWFDPSADTVGVRGDRAPLSWEATLPAADSDGDGWYETTVTFPEPGPFAFKFKIDDAVGDAPNGGWEPLENRQYAAGGAGAVEVAFREMGPPTYTGDIRIHEGFSSRHVAEERRLIVYLPPGYDDTDASYPVLYMHDGQNVFDATAMGMEWGLDETAEALIAAGRIEPLIIVGVENTPDRTREYTPTPNRSRGTAERAGGAGPAVDGLARYEGTYAYSDEELVEVRVEGEALVVHIPGEAPVTARPEGRDQFGLLPGARLHFVRGSGGRVVAADWSRTHGGGGDAFGRFLVEEVKPFIDRTYRTKPGRAHTALGGSSLGGLSTLYHGLRRPGVFGGLLVVSPSVWWNDRMLIDHVRALEAPTGQRIWVDIGTGEGHEALQGVRALRNVLVEEGWTEGETLRYVEDRGAEHNEGAWAGRAAGMLEFLYGASGG